jgi:ABC-type Mn2+/Zn2+ transport system ATPase subunit
VTGTGVGPALVTLTGVTAGYGGRPALRDVDLVLRTDQITGVVGPSGSGKTTLLRVLLGMLAPSAGTVDRAPRSGRVSVPQLETVNWNFPVTVFECVSCRARGAPAAVAECTERAEVGEVLDRLGIADLAGRHIRALSGGQQQRMFLARALLRRPTLLLLDEPTSGVDIGTRHDVLHLLQDLHEDGLSILLTTHDLNGMAAHLPHLVCLNHRVVASGTPDEVITPDVLEQTFGARMEVLQHLGMPVVVDDAGHGRRLG